MIPSDPRECASWPTVRLAGGGRSHHQPTRLSAIWDVLCSIDAVNCAKKPAVVFASYGLSGEAAESCAPAWPSLVRRARAGYGALFTSGRSGGLRADGQEAAEKIKK